MLPKMYADDGWLHVLVLSRRSFFGNELGVLDASKPLRGTRRLNVTKRIPLWLLLQVINRNRI